MKFSELKLSDKSQKSISNYGYVDATEVQVKTIPKIIEGKNLIVRSQTGTGKTAAFTIGLMERMASGEIQSFLVLVPTRELAVQVSKEMHGLMQVHQYKIVSIFGGIPINKQIAQLKKHYDIIVATPGRFIDLMQRGKLDPNIFTVAVLDEADLMLDMGFQKDVFTILSHIPMSQSLLFSATVDERIRKISSRFMPDSELVTVGQMEKVASIKEEKVKLNRADRYSRLKGLLESHQGEKIIVFARTKRGVMGLKRRLERSGLEGIGMLQGDMPQSRRLNVLNQYREGKLSVLVATNVASRGIHVDDVNLIINYDEAEDNETHLHRVGRTGRMGSEGKVVTFLCMDEAPTRPPKRTGGAQRRSGRPIRRRRR